MRWYTAGEDRKLRKVVAVLGLLGILSSVGRESPAGSHRVAQDIGPKRGSLVLAGGGSRLMEAGILRRFLELAGGPHANIVVIPTAGEDATAGPSSPGLRDLRDAGAKQITVLHTKDRTVADSDTFVKPLLAAKGVWIPGGRHWRLADSYLNTRTHRALQALLDRGGVIGGTSAGATIQGSFMVRGDTKVNTVMVGDH